MITFEFWGESHGEGYGGVIRGLPVGVIFDVGYVNEQLARRKQGFGRSSRQQFADHVSFDGFADIVTVNGDLTFRVPNANHGKLGEITALRSGHADLVGQARYGGQTAREIAEIASARNSVCYVVLGAICKQILENRGIFTYHYVERIGGISSRNRYRFGISEKEEHFALLHCPCRYATKLMAEKIEQARQDGDSLGGIVAVGATGVEMGIGEVLPYSERLDAQISANLMGIPSVKGITFGLGSKYADLTGRESTDELSVEDGKIVYATDKCGGIVAGISTGGDILCRLFVKPVPTVSGAETVDSRTLGKVTQHVERADTCVVPQVGVIAENILAYVLLNQIIKQGK